MHVTISHQPAERFSSFSSGSLILRRLPHPLHVAHRWDAEEAFVLADGPPDPFNQFLAIGLHPLGLACCLLVIYYIHRHLFSCCSIIYLEDPQNQTIICDNHSTTRYEGASIIEVMKTSLPVFTRERAVVLRVTRNGVFSQALTLDRAHASQLS